MFRALQLTVWRLVPGHVEGWAGGLPCACPLFRWFWLTPAPIGKSETNLSVCPDPFQRSLAPSTTWVRPGLLGVSGSGAGLRPASSDGPARAAPRWKRRSACPQPTPRPPCFWDTGRCFYQSAQWSPVTDHRPHHHPRVGNTGLRFHRCGT